MMALPPGLGLGEAMAKGVAHEADDGGAAVRARGAGLARIDEERCMADYIECSDGDLDARKTTRACPPRRTDRSARALPNDGLDATMSTDRLEQTSPLASIDGEALSILTQPKLTMASGDDAPSIGRGRVDATTDACGVPTFASHVRGRRGRGGRGGRGVRGGGGRGSPRTSPDAPTPKDTLEQIDAKCDGSPTHSACSTSTSSTSPPTSPALVECATSEDPEMEWLSRSLCMVLDDDQLATSDDERLDASDPPPNPLYQRFTSTIATPMLKHVLLPQDRFQRNWTPLSESAVMSTTTAVEKTTRSPCDTGALCVDVDVCSPSIEDDYDRAGLDSHSSNFSSLSDAPTVSSSEANAIGWREETDSDLSWGHNGHGSWYSQPKRQHWEGTSEKAFVQRTPPRKPVRESAESLYGMMNSHESERLIKFFKERSRSWTIARLRASPSGQELMRIIFERRTAWCRHARVGERCAFDEKRRQFNGPRCNYLHSGQLRTPPTRDAAHALFQEFVNRYCV